MRCVSVEMRSTSSWLHVHDQGHKASAGDMLLPSRPSHLKREGPAKQPLVVAPESSRCRRNPPFDPVCTNSDVSSVSLCARLWRRLMPYSFRCHCSASRSACTPAPLP